MFLFDPHFSGTPIRFIYNRMSFEYCISSTIDSFTTILNTLISFIYFEAFIAFQIRLYFDMAAAHMILHFFRELFRQLRQSEAYLLRLPPESRFTRGDSWLSLYARRPMIRDAAAAIPYLLFR